MLYRVVVIHDIYEIGPKTLTCTYTVLLCVVYILQYAREHNNILPCLRAVHHGPPLCHKRGESNRSLARRDNRCGTHPTTAAAAAELSHSICYYYFIYIYITARNIMHNATARTTTGAKRFIGFRRSGCPDKTANLYILAYTQHRCVQYPSVIGGVIIMIRV